MAHWICELCGEGFRREKNGRQSTNRFCSQRCYHDWRKAHGVTAGQFEKEHTPWNKGMDAVLPQAKLDQQRKAALAYHYRHRDSMLVQARRYYAEHLDEIRARARKWRQTERGRLVCQLKTARRTALKAGLLSTLTEAEWQRVVTHFGSCCAYCGADDIALAQDHVIALVNAGGYTADNIVPACKRCNSSKHNMALEDWASGRGAGFVLPDAVASVRAYLEIVGATS